MRTADFVVIGGGIAGASAAARLARHGQTILLEAEDAFGYHSSGRSATHFHFGIGKSVVRGLTAFSRLELEGRTVTGVELSRASPALFVATEEMLEELDRLQSEMSPFSSQLDRLSPDGVKALVPTLRFGAGGIVAGLIDRSARRLDSEAMQQDCRAQLKQHGGQAFNQARVVSIAREPNCWTVTTAKGERFGAPVLVNAAGAWGDEIARLAGVRPLDLAPLRRTIIGFDGPDGVQTRTWPFTKTVVDDFYMLPESGGLLACPVDEVPSDPGDARPEDYDIALAASKVEQYTTMPVPRIRHSWAGLRTFVRDRVPVAGFAPDAEGFFWLVGQGGYGLQTAPAMAIITESVITGTAWPEGLTEWGIAADTMLPDRLAVAASE